MSMDDTLNEENNNNETIYTHTHHLGGVNANIYTTGRFKES